MPTKPPTGLPLSKSKTKPPKLVSFEKILRMCFKDPKFFDALCKNTTLALKHHSVTLSPSDRLRLDTHIGALTPHEIAIYRMLFTFTRAKKSLWITLKPAGNPKGNWP
jgi:hypothetical protein